MVAFVSARFIGNHDSMSYKTGEAYSLKVTQSVFGTRITVQRVQGMYDDTVPGTWCPYDNIITFTKNWEIL